MKKIYVIVLCLIVCFAFSACTHTNKIRIIKWQSDPSNIIEETAEPLMERMNLQIVENIIANSDSFKDIIYAFEKRQAQPDYVGESGESLIEYWFDPQGNEKIIITYETQYIGYVNAKENLHVMLYG